MSPIYKGNSPDDRTHTFSFDSYVFFFRIFTKALVRIAQRHVLSAGLRSAATA